MADEPNIFADPEFRKLSGVEKIQVLDQLDPDFARLPANKKPGVIFDAINGVPMASKNKGLFYQAGQFAKTLGQDVAGVATGLARAVAPEIDVMQGRPTVGQEMVGAQKRQFEKAGEEFRQGRYSEAAGHGLAGALPLVGPLAAETGEEIGEGEYGKAAAHGLELSLPYTARPLARGVTATARGGARAVQGGAGAAARAAELPVIRNVPFVRNIRGMLKDIAGRNPGMSPQELAQGLYKEVNGRAPQTAGEKIEAVRMYREAVKPPKPPKPEKPTAPEPFKPSAATARQMKFGGATEPEFTTPRGIAPKRVFGKPARELPESFTPGATETVTPKAPEPFKTSAATARKMKFGGRTEPGYGPGAKPRRGINRAMIPEKKVAEGAEEVAGEAARPGPQPPTGEGPTFGRERFQAVAAAAKDQAILPTLDELKLSPEEIENPNVLSDQDIDKIIDKVNVERTAFNKTAKEKGLNKLSIFKHPDPKMESYRTYQELRTSWARAKRIRDALKSRPPGSVQ